MVGKGGGVKKWLEKTKKELIINFPLPGKFPLGTN
jgi:hypothetical protein